MKFKMFMKKYCNITGPILGYNINADLYQLHQIEFKFVLMHFFQISRLERFRNFIQPFRKIWNYRFRITFLEYELAFQNFGIFRISRLEGFTRKQIPYQHWFKQLVIQGLFRHFEGTNCKRRINLVKSVIRNQ